MSIGHPYSLFEEMSIQIFSSFFKMERFSCFVFVNLREIFHPTYELIIFKNAKVNTGKRNSLYSYHSEINIINIWFYFFRVIVLHFIQISFVINIKYVHAAFF